MITIKPFGGLANRMRALDSCFRLAKKSQRPLHLIWEKNFELNCSIHKLFEIPEGITIEERRIGRKVLALKKRIYKALRFFGFKIPPGYDFYLFNKDIVRLKEQDFDFKEILKYKSIFISTIAHFYKTQDSFYYFRPVAELQEKIDIINSQYSKRTIGIHIRRTDNANSIKYSPLSSFLNYMEEEIAKNRDTKFFLATDSLEVSKTVFDKFGDQIISHDKDLDRNTEKGIQDALIDMYCLSNCIKIVGSYYSSFSEVAAQINNIELFQIYETNNTA